MPKIKKYTKRITEQQKAKEELLKQKREMYRSSVNGIIAGAVMLIISALLNGNIIKTDFPAGSAADILITLIKVLSIVLFFTFVFLGLANTMELRGKPATLKELILIAVLALVQAIRSAVVFWLSAAGIALILLYLWAVQAKLE